MRLSMYRIVLFAMSAMLAIAAAPSASAQGGGGLPGMNGGMASPEQMGSGTGPVSVTVHTSRQRVEQGGQFALAVVLEYDGGWHSWPNVERKDALPDVIAEFVVDNDTWTDIALEDVPEGFTAGPTQWPEMHEAPVPNFGAGPSTIDAPTYSGRAIAYIPIVVSEDASTGSSTLTARAFFQACDDTTCARPETKTPSVSVEIVADPSEASPPGTSELFDEFNPRVFSSMLASPQGGSGSGTDSGTDTPATAESEENGAVAPASRRSLLGIIPVPSPTSPAGIIGIALLAAMGGFILNLTPCVLPVIPIKVMSITQHSGSYARTLMLGLWMAIGVTAFWAAIGIPAAFVSGWADPSRIFGYWWLTLGIGVLIGIMGVGIMGTFSLNLPSKVYAFNPKADSAGGSFFFGVMTGVLGLPCFGFVAGALLVASATWPSWIVMLVFTAMGAGMAAPYLVLSIFPKLVSKVPKTGPASELVKQVMGLMLLAAAAYFAGSGLIAAVNEMPYLSRQLHWWIVAIFAAAAGLWLIVRTFRITSSAAARTVFSVVGIIIGGVAVAYVTDSTITARHEWLASRDAGDLPTNVWVEYTPQRLEKARGTGKVVFLDFTAEWCITCKALKSGVLKHDPVKSVLDSEDVIKITVDLTANSSPGWDLLEELGQTGLPQWAVYGPGFDGEEPRLVDNHQYPPGVVALLKRARGDGATASGEGGPRRTSRADAAPDADDPL